MKVLFQSRATLFSDTGGDTVQVLKTAEALRDYGCEVDLSLELEPDVRAYDIVHLFNLTRPQEVYVQARNAKTQGKRVALSTIYVDYTHADRYARTGVSALLGRILTPTQMEYAKAMARAVVKREWSKGTAALLGRGFRPLQEKTARMADVFLPNSQSEMQRVISDFPFLESDRFVVVPNAVEPSEFAQTDDPLCPIVEELDGCVLCVGRIESRKNQLNLVRAMNQLPWPLVLVGRPAPNQKSYFARVKREAAHNVHFAGFVPHELLPRYYRAAKVHALVSWMETTGLASLEAGMAGCNLVVTDKGDTSEYFSGFARFCDPGSPDSIRQAIAAAYAAPVNPTLRAHILQNYTWNKTAEATLEGYGVALASNSHQVATVRPLDVTARN